MGGYKVKIAICDDNETELAVTEQAVKEFIFSNKSNDEITLKTFRSGLDLLSFANTSIAFDLLILDIIMPDINGIALAEEIRQKNKDCKIIFLTTSPEFAVNSYDVNAFHYLIKPFQKEKLGTILKRALNDIGEEKSESILIKDKKCLTKINLHTIVYIESVKHTINFHLIDGNVAICYGKMDEYVDILSKAFVPEVLLLTCPRVREDIV